MITISVMLVNGQLVGYNVSSRWNLVTLFGTDRIDPSDLKKFRAVAKDMGLKINTIKRAKPQWRATPAEKAALGDTAPIYTGQQAVA
jgi:hypothetical protein